MGNYSLTAIFTKEPAAIAAGVRTVLWVLVLVGVLVMEDKTLAGIALALEVVLTLFVRSQSTSKTSPTLPLATPVAIATPAGAPSDTPPPDAVVALRSDLLPSAAATYAPPT